MTVERSVAPGPVQGAQGGHGNGKAAAAPGGGLAESGGDFSALLMMLGTDDAAELGTAQQASTVPLPLPLPVPVPVPLVLEAAVLNPGLLLAQATHLQPGLPTTQSVPERMGSDAPDLLSQAVRTGPPPRGVQAAALALDSARLDGARTEVREQDSETQLALTDATGQESKDRPLDPASLRHACVASDAAQSGHSRSAAQEQDHKLMHPVDRKAQGADPTQTVQAATSETGVRQSERVASKSALKPVAGSEGGLWGYQALAEAGRINPPAPTTGTAVLSPEMMVAEQVSYWIGQDMQNAEFKLDGLGDSPVKVSISLQGKEAHIVFRTDQSEARQVLEGAVSHLKDLLGSEGLVLSSVSVGGSGSRGDDPREKALPEQRRQFAVKLPDATGAETGSRPGRTTGRMVDLFV